MKFAITGKKKGRGPSFHLLGKRRISPEPQKKRKRKKGETTNLIIYNQKKVWGGTWMITREGRALINH